MADSKVSKLNTLGSGMAWYANVPNNPGWIPEACNSKLAEKLRILGYEYENS
jgi:hypothetical protein